MKHALLPLLLLVPNVIFAQGLFDYIPSLIAYLFSTIIPFMLGVAFLAVAINTVRYFVIGSTSEEGREKAKSSTIFSILAFLVIIAFWGIINLLTNATGLNGANAPTPDIPGYPTSNSQGGTGSQNPACSDPNASQDTKCLCGDVSACITN